VIGLLGGETNNVDDIKIIMIDASWQEASLTAFDSQRLEVSQAEFLVRRCIKGMRDIVNIACGLERSTPSMWYRVAGVQTNG
jgi:hypothetical protein